MNTADITPLILTYNEGPNIKRTLMQLAWAKRILILDSFSTDETLEIARTFPQTEIIQRQFDSFARQCNYGLTRVHTPWVLSLDADYVVSDELNRELAALHPAEDIKGFSASFTYCIYGRPLRRSLYPARTVLYRRNAAEYRDDGHGHRVQVQGLIQTLHGRILHDDRKPLTRWLASQDKYAQTEARHLLAARPENLRFPDRVRRLIVPAPFLVGACALFAKRLFLDGWPGWFYAFQRVLAEILLSLRLIELRLTASPHLPTNREAATPITNIKA